MQALDEEVKAAGITVMNEIGVTRNDVIDRVHKEGGSVRASRSFCGGLPAPESMTMMIMIAMLDSDNPLVNTDCRISAAADHNQGTSLAGAAVEF
ncbi:Saccharopine dehydrogenase [NADP(+), L-glutamate-forming] [Tolypocladium paradoxum]|uniref:Saccharopine dehydrogenase [NADP(+), L-glutamate-forming] n=1 Tax=Tolypocladium paradoxum TaxID=94208 RepID=A0A2S4L7L7_9HYPO|nr:Saccharopine dehydrogenase [NADP(+), L-glutamate-forming] [Tolypocladium paradoxum]